MQNCCFVKNACSERSRSKMKFKGEGTVAPGLLLKIGLGRRLRKYVTPRMTCGIFAYVILRWNKSESVHMFAIIVIP